MTNVDWRLGREGGRRRTVYPDCETELRSEFPFLRHFMIDFGVTGFLGLFSSAFMGTQKYCMYFLMRMPDGTTAMGVLQKYAWWSNVSYVLTM